MKYYDDIKTFLSEILLEGKEKYVFPYNERQSEQLIGENGTDETSLEEHSLIDIMDIMAFFHTSRGEQLRDKMVLLGLSEEEAERLEHELEKGKNVIIGCKAD
ncbi:general stress protein [Bacillus sp. FJAT-27245]|uniref:general stress protein n=1 Tax=Bacillus sp. FJAT-27245 TaxID=1684144 RepID=UPI0006A7CF94|nr:general stress protein [Bacillus sp. FJAT-27245]